MFIYLIVNHITGKYYIGQHKGNNLKKYLQQKVSQAWYELKRKGHGRGSHLFNSIRKHGREAFTIHALLSDIKTRPELDQHEKDFIAFLKSRDHEFGYNICRGGEGGNGPGKGNTNGRGRKGRKHSEETLQKISESRKGKCLGNQHTLGLKHTEEWKAAMSKRALGVHQEGHSTDEVRLHLSLSHMGNKPTEETKRKMREGQKRAWIQRRLSKPSIGTQQ